MRFFKLGNACKRGALTASWTGPTTYEETVAATRHLRSPTAPLEFEYHMGRRAYDFIWIQASGALISRRALEALRESGITGFATYAAVLHGFHSGLAQEYSFFAITGRCRTIRLDEVHSMIVYKEFPAGTRPVIQGIWFDRESWDGSDLFVAEDDATRFTLATEKSKEAFEAAGISNVEFKDIAEVNLPLPKPTAKIMGTIH